MKIYFNIIDKIKEWSNRENPIYANFYTGRARKLAAQGNHISKFFKVFNIYLNLVKKVKRIEEKVQQRRTNFFHKLHQHRLKKKRGAFFFL